MSASRIFYRFSGAPSLLIGLMPFFIPVILWQQGYRVADVSLFIAITGAAYIVTLYAWQRLYDWATEQPATRKTVMWRLLIGLSFAAELALICALSLGQGRLFLVGAALLNGVYNCLYWTSQRVMFSNMTKELADNKVGNHFGNFQIMVFILVKLGILAGAYLQQYQPFYLLFIVSAILSACAMYLLFFQRFNVIKPLEETTPLRLNRNHKLVFLVDGIFLFFESYFWLLTLYFISEQQLINLGLTVVALTLLLSLIFIVIKQRIDSCSARKVFYAAIALYMLSWGLRGMISEPANDVMVYAMVILVTFCSSFFRLSFNKRFFDQVNLQGSQQQSLQLIVNKSYLSQAGMVVFFGALAFVLYWRGESVDTLSMLYWLMLPVTLIYGLYALPFLLPENSDTSRVKSSVGENL